MKYNNYIFIVVAASLLAITDATIPSGGDLMDKVYTKCKSDGDCKTAQGFSCCVVTKEGDATQGTYCLAPTKERTKGQYVTKLPDGKTVNQYFQCNPSSVLSTPVNGDSKKDTSSDKAKVAAKAAADVKKTTSAEAQQAAKKAVAAVDDAVKKADAAKKAAADQAAKKAEADAAAKAAANAVQKSKEAQKQAQDAAMKAAGANKVDQKSKLDVLQKAANDAAIKSKEAQVNAAAMEQAYLKSQEKLQKVSLSVLVTNSKLKVAKANVIAAAEAKKAFEIKKAKLKIEMEQCLLAAKEADKVAYATSLVYQATTKDNNVVQAKLKEAQDQRIVEQAKKSKFDSDVKDALAIATKVDAEATKLDKELVENTKAYNAAVKTSQEKKVSLDKANLAVVNNLKAIKDKQDDNDKKLAASKKATKAYQDAIQATKDKAAVKKTADSNVVKPNQDVASATANEKAKKQAKVLAENAYLSDQLKTKDAQAAKDKADKAVNTADAVVTKAGDDATDDEKAALKKAKDTAESVQKTLNQAQTNEKASKTASDTATLAYTDAQKKLSDAKNTQETVVKAANAAGLALKNAQTDESSKKKVADEASKAYLTSKLNLEKEQSQKPILEKAAELAKTANDNAIKTEKELKVEVDKCKVLCQAADIKQAAANKDLAKKKEIADAQNTIFLAAKKKQDQLQETASTTSKLAQDATSKYLAAQIANTTASSKCPGSIAAYEQCMKDCVQKEADLANAQKAVVEATKQNELANLEVVKCAADGDKAEKEAKMAKDAALLAEYAQKEAFKKVLEQKGIYDKSVLEHDALIEAQKIKKSADEEIKQNLKDQLAKEVAANKTAAKDQTQTVTVTNTTELIKEAEAALKNISSVTSVLEQINLAPQGENASFNIKWGQDQMMVDSKTFKNGTQSLTQILKFDKYFMHSFDTNSQKPGDPTPQCSKTKDCNQNIDQVCCANAVMTDQVLGKQMSVYRCMNKDVVTANFDLEIDGFAVSMRCVGETSSAFAMAVNGFLATLSLIAFLTF